MKDVITSYSIHYTKLYDVFNPAWLCARGQVSLFLKNDLSDEQSTIFTDPVKLHKILSNLIENALKFTYEGFVRITSYNVCYTKLLRKMIIARTK